MAPCKIEEAVTQAKDGDSVSLAGGEYTLPLAGLTLEEEIDFGGPVGGTAVLETNQSGTGLRVQPSAGATVHDLRLEGSGELILGRGSTADRVFVVDNGLGTSPLVNEAACSLEIGSILRDSVCWATKTIQESKSAETNALTASPASSCGEGQEDPIALRNVTAISWTAKGNAILAEGACNATLTMDAGNVIARAANVADIATDVTGESNPRVRLNVFNSNFGSVVENPPITEVTPNGVAGNQSAPPLFVNAAAGDFHQAANSPTLDGGFGDHLVGGFDLDGNPRTQASCLGGTPVPDIGAYEQSPFAACPAPPPQTSPPPEAPKPVFRILSVKLNKKTGGGRVFVEVPGPGTLAITGSGIKLVRRTAASAGQIVSMPLQPWAITLVRLKKRGRTKVKVKVTFEPMTGPPALRARGVLLRRARR